MASIAEVASIPITSLKIDVPKSQINPVPHPISSKESSPALTDNCFKILPRQALHAKTLGFEHPTTKEFLRFNSEIPQDMVDCLEKWRTYTVNQK